jgi:uncharacterized membrane protein
MTTPFTAPLNNYGIFWVGQQTQLNHLSRSDRNLSWIHMAFLAAVTITPFTTGLLARFMPYRVALVAYWMNLLALGAILYASWGYATRRAMVEQDVPEAVVAAVCRRIVIAQSLYGFGALLCILGTYWSVGFIVLVQIYYAIAPDTWRGA